MLVLRRCTTEQASRSVASGVVSRVVKLGGNKHVAGTWDEPKGLVGPNRFDNT